MNTLPAEAAFCSTRGDRTICLLQIKRSAKNYWEYRVKASVNGRPQPLTIVNCRTHQRQQGDRLWEPFSTNGVGALVCKTLDKS